MLFTPVGSRRATALVLQVGAAGQPGVQRQLEAGRQRGDSLFMIGIGNGRRLKVLARPSPISMALLAGGIGQLGKARTV